MNITTYTSTTPGDVMEISLAQIFYSIASFTGYTDVTVGENGTRYFRKEFCYSICGLPFSNWTSLTDQNIAAIVPNNYDFYFFKFRYIHVYDGVPSTLSGTIQFTSIAIDHTHGALPVNNDVFNKSIFSQFIESYGYDTLLWTISVFEKLYQKGIIPSYIIRGEDNSVDDDRDFIDLWVTICQFFAIIVVFAREFELFDANEELLYEYLKQRNLFSCPSSSLTILAYLEQNYYREIRKRGTKEIVSSTTLNETTIYGELLRLICYASTDEFLINITRNNDVGLTVERSSPLYKGLTQHKYFHKAFEDTQDVTDLAVYSIDDDHATVAKVTDGTKSVIKISTLTTNNFGGITPISGEIAVDPTLDYEITFWVNQKTLGTHLHFGVISYDIANAAVSNCSIIDGTDSDTFFTDKSLNVADTFYFVRGIIYNKDHELIPDTLDNQLNIGFGNNLKFKDSSVVYIYPYIGAKLGGIAQTVEVELWDVKIKPLSTEYSTGFVQLSNFIEFWIKNNNNNLRFIENGYSIEVPELEYNLRKFLLNYRNIFKIKYIAVVTPTAPISGDVLIDVGDGTVIGDGSDVIGYST